MILPTLPTLLPESAKDLVRMGVYSLYECTYESNPLVKFLLITTGKSSCGCGSGGHPKQWLLSEDGAVISSTDGKYEVKNLKVVR